DTLALGGKGKATFDVSSIGTQYQGFGIFVKTGTSNWTLTGTTTAATSWQIQAGTLDVATLGAAGTGAITFGNGSATLDIDNAALSNHSFQNSIANFHQGDVIDLTGLKFAAGASVSYSSASNTLKVTSDGVTDTLTLVAPAGTNFKVVRDGNGGTEIL